MSITYIHKYKKDFILLLFKGYLLLRVFGKTRQHYHLSGLNKEKIS